MTPLQKARLKASKVCGARPTHCATCRLATPEGQQWRASFGKRFGLVAEIEPWECPHFWLGDLAAAFIARTGLAALWHKLRPAKKADAGCGGCKARQAKLNELGFQLTR